MKVLLRNDIRGVGRRGDIVEVKKGFARNFLLPNGDALEANDIMEIQAASMRRLAMFVTLRAVKLQKFSASLLSRQVFLFQLVLVQTVVSSVL